MARSLGVSECQAETGLMELEGPRDRRSTAQVIARHQLRGESTLPYCLPGDGVLGPGEVRAHPGQRRLVVLGDALQPF